MLRYRLLLGMLMMREREHACLCILLEKVELMAAFVNRLFSLAQTNITYAPDNV